jgi:mannose-6-phosphate isomerase-like protein (cupin superfamily)
LTTRQPFATMRASRHSPIGAARMPADPVQVDPKHYTVEYENDRVRVLRIRYGIGEKSVMHSHPDSVAIVLSNGRVAFDFPDGKHRETDVKTGDVHWHHSGDHQPHNIGSSPLEVLMVELK